jgi:hypothetical protein
MALYFFKAKLDGITRGLVANSVDNIDIARGILQGTYGADNVIGLERVPGTPEGQKRLDALIAGVRQEQQAANQDVAAADRRRSGDFIPNPFVPNHNPVTSVSAEHSMHAAAKAAAAAELAAAAQPAPAVGPVDGD